MKAPEFTEQESSALRTLREKGFAVVLWHPQELGTASPRLIEERCLEAGYQAIQASQSQDN